MERITDQVLDTSLEGTSLYQSEDETATLRDQLDPERPTLLVFLRHLGCIFSRELVKDVRTAADRADSVATGRGEKRYPRVVFVHMGDPDQGARFFGRRWPGAPAISDPEKDLYDAFDLTRGSFSTVLGPRVWACALRATLKGHRQGRFVGDPWTMPGLFLATRDGRILHHHRFTHAGDHPDVNRYADLDAFTQLSSPVEHAESSSDSSLERAASVDPCPRPV